jgi:quercetin dioxygenase-like cupin family protein
MMMSEAFNWVPSRTLAGVDVKHMGTFSEHETSVGFLRINKGAEIPERVHEDAEILYMTEGEIDYDGKRWGKGTYFFIPVGARAGRVRGAEESTFFRIGLPMIRNLMDQKRSNDG